MKNKKYIVTAIIILPVLLYFSWWLSTDRAYYKRTYISEALAISSKCKIIINNYYDQNNKLMADSYDCGWEKADTKAVKNLNIINGEIHIVFNNEVKDGALLVLKPVLEENKIKWICSRELFGKDDKYVPLSCK